MMRILNILLLVLLMAAPVVADADAKDIPGSAVWYVHVDLEQMRANGPGRGVYDWLDQEALSEVRDEAGIDIGKELDRLTAYALDETGPVVLLEGDFSQKTRDQLMAFVAAEGDLRPKKASGTAYYHLTPDGDAGGNNQHNDAESSIDFDLEDEGFLSLDLKGKIIFTASEEQMRGMLANKGRIRGSNGHKDALLILSAEKNLLQAGMHSTAFAGEFAGNGGGGFESNIMRNTEKVAILVAAVKDKLALEAELVTTEAEMAQALASVVRGLISLVALSEDVDTEMAAVILGTRVDAKGNNLSISLAIDPDLVVQTLSD